MARNIAKLIDALFCSAVLSAIAVPLGAHAQLVGYRFEGTIDHANGGVITLGDRFEGTFSLDLANLDVDPDPAHGQHVSLGLLANNPPRVTYQAGLISYNSVLLFWSITDSAHDELVIDSQSSLSILEPRNEAQIKLTDPTGLAFLTDATPAALNLTDFSMSRFEAAIGSQTSFGGPLSVLEPIVVPEPDGCVLIIAAAFLAGSTVMQRHCLSQKLSDARLCGLGCAQPPNPQSRSGVQLRQMLCRAHRLVSVLLNVIQRAQDKKKAPATKGTVALSATYSHSSPTHMKTLGKASSTCES